MSCSYAEGLSPYENKGKLGLKEVFESDESLVDKVKQLSKWITSSNHVVVHTGAGISTSAGIPDFRGPKGVWTLEEQGKKPEISISFNDALPTKTHMILVKLVEAGYIKYIVSQNIDGLHLRSGLKREYLSELHGNMFINQCSSCKRQFVRKTATTSVGQKCLGLNCPGVKTNGRQCRGVLHDFILDWEHSLPEKDLDLAHYHSNLADLSICLGTTLQIIPSGNLPLFTKKNQNGKLVICNLQPTKYDKRADMLLNGYVDQVMSLLLENLDLKIDNYNPEFDPVRKKGIHEWTIPDSQAGEMKKLYEIHLKQRKTYDEEQRKRKIDDKTEVIPIKKS
ncbi:NAD-dependent protein deacetylase Sirt6 [Halyomorpha halys]|uniref:NAD-dependent protein deacetylase Sirt6 n=1 Tax=Halyomorpha halys TaxID=286706 RepID=UPI0006D52446|nr:NAD-dependent protein deacetylase Sirt6 [Halyomorpha halys]